MNNSGKKIKHDTAYSFKFLNSFLEKYPQIKKLFGVDETFKWKVFCLVLTQFVMLFVMRHQTWPIVILAGYLFGGVINHALMLGKISRYINYPSIILQYPLFAIRKNMITIFQPSMKQLMELHSGSSFLPQTNGLEYLPIFPLDYRFQLPLKDTI